MLYTVNYTYILSPIAILKRAVVPRIHSIFLENTERKIFVWLSVFPEAVLDMGTAIKPESRIGPAEKEAWA